ncbi:ABC transporter ATP-binding protein [Xylophilus sp.]|uniref:ABC transporter ATP-binding protein n=1 Tax=Xylophilus sp. TaxID=2653893 RepID=UPI0013BCF268|nr:ABC transporter ATP-binding protein [Xylophilus sp.]KAF1048791.1 MAG: putative multidrug export ATP-binding/permease protein [Xylophilus sp.]
MLRPFFRYFESRVAAFPETEPPRPPRGFFPFVWVCTEGVRPVMALLAVAAALLAGFEALLFAVLGRIVDWLAGVAPAQLWQTHGAALATLAVLLALSVPVTGLQTMLRHQTLASNFAMRLRWNFHRLMLGQSMAFYQDEFAGRVTAKVMQTALAVRDLIMSSSDALVTMVVYFVTIAALAAGFDARLALPFLAWVVLYGLMLRHFVPRLGRAARLQADARSLMTGRITDAYTNIATVKLFSHTNREAGYARSAMKEFLRSVHGQVRLISSFEIANHTLNMALVAAAAGTGLALWTRGQVGPGAVAAAAAMALRLNGMSHWIMWEMTSLFENVGTIQDGKSTLSKPRAVVDAPDAQPLRVARGEVRFDGVRFAYGNGRTVVDGLTLTVKPGERIGLVGRSGAGKSTLVNLLLRFYDLQGGCVTIDGQDIARVTQDSLRAQIGMVTQDTSLLHRSVSDNILYGRPDAGEDAVRAAARRAQADGFIAHLADPQGRTGYEAHVDERGVKLSGGQRQRIAIARVMLKDAPILLLDEATSALDSEVEAAIQASLGELMRGKTVIAIAHRLSTIAAMDRLVVMDAGRIAEEGTHQELLARGGLYARLWAHQSGGFLGKEG